MLKGLAITPPVVGRISIGRVVERNGKRLPEKDDQFTLTSQVQNREGWILHPLDEALRKDAGGKLRSVPVQLLFDDPALNLRADYSLFDRSTGRPVCVGNGETSRRMAKEGVTQESCPGPDACAFAMGECKAYARLNVRVGEEDELGSFVLRTTSYNTIRTLAARLQYFHAVSGGRLACMPLELKLRGKSTTMSFRSAIYYVDLVVRSGLTLEQAITQAREVDQSRRDAGFDQEALDEAARRGFANGAFEDLAEDVPAVVEEFYPDSQEPGSGAPAQTSDTVSLHERLQKKVARAGTA
ncbi:MULTISPECIES: hydrolase or metal-binding protein [Stenotrophomonas]|uniref:recombination directionality factor n=1 Tax=Stenotrophomonas TaxID=40323 RepID=UPI000C1572CB|nr:MULTISPECIES: hydrolase or metal-binding protein [Stenotrophomonas maltophilia group]PZS98697.1 hydrolase or metal-binding protein [Stenotrophomonas maltophilia]PZT32379.1 hydrolase or metal-binding protein [Stenotrophomonas sepilia]